MDVYKKINQLKYSQNFLNNNKLVERIINQSSIGSQDVVYEIGPGKGIITEQLAKRCTKVIGIEKDEELYKRLSQKFKDNDRIKIRYGDFLSYNLPRNEKYKVFSNIPFNLTADIITKLTSAINPPEDTYLIIQDEAARKFAGSPYGKERQYSLFLKPWFELKILHYFEQTDFFPVPQVKIVLLQIKKREKSLVKREKSQFYRDFIVYGFNQWKLTLKSALKKIFTYQQLKKLSRNLDFNLSATPTDLNFNQWLGLFDYFLVGVIARKRNLILSFEEQLKRQQKHLLKIHRTGLKD